MLTPFGSLEVWDEAGPPKLGECSTEPRDTVGTPMDCERSPVGGERTGANPTFRGMEPPMEWVGPPMTEPVEAWTVAAVALATQQDGVKYAELALGLPLVSYIAPPALPS